MGAWLAPKLSVPSLPCKTCARCVPPGVQALRRLRWTVWLELQRNVLSAPLHHPARCRKLGGDQGVAWLLVFRSLISSCLALLRNASFQSSGAWG